jgi:RNA-directed DNA polymerase
MNHDENTNRPAIVEAGKPPKQAGEIRDRWWWVEHEVWTERMLERLEQSGPGTNWFALWDKVWGPDNLRRGLDRVWRNRGGAGIDQQSVKAFDEQQKDELARLGDELKAGAYRPKPAKRVWIPKPGSTEKRPLGIPAVRDRVVQTALRNVIEPIFEREFAQNSYGFRPGRGCQQAVEEVERLLKEGRVICVDIDLKSFFDTIPHPRLLDMIGGKITDGKVRRLIEQYLKAGVMEELKGWIPSEQGTPQGAVISPLLANIYLNPLDHLMIEKGWSMVRYADDMVVLCRTKEEADEVMACLRQWTQEAGLTLHPVKTCIVNVMTEGFDFLGWTFRGGKKWPRKKSVQKLQEKLRPITRRKMGESLGAIIARLNPILKGWRGYFGQSPACSLRTRDAWTRRRLRAMLRKREKRPGWGANKGDHQKWPNRWFSEQGLYSLEHGSSSYV